MCNALSYIVMRPINDALDIRVLEFTDEHKAIIAANGLREDTAQEYFVRIEDTPPDGQWADLDAYVMEVDEPTTPAWFDDDLRMRVDDWRRKYVQSRTITGTVKCLMPGRWFCKGEVTVEALAGPVLLHVDAKAKVSLPNIATHVDFGPLFGTVTMGNVDGTVTTGIVSGTVMTGIVRGMVTTGNVDAGGTVTTGDVRGTVKTGIVSGTVKRGGK